MSLNFESMNDDSYKEDEVVAEIREEDKKNQKKFIAVLIVAFFGGGLLGLFFSYGAGNQEIMSRFAARMGDLLKAVSPYMILLTAVIAAAAEYLLYKMARRDYANWNKEKEEGIETIEGKLGLGLMIGGVETILFFLFTMIFLDDLTSGIKNENIHGDALRILVYALGFFTMILSQPLGQQKIINFVKEMNPEKKGSVLDFKFQKKWLKSCDEAQKMAVYKAAYHSYMVTGKVYVILMLLNLAGITLWNWGIVPAVMIAIMWLTSVISYYVGAGKR